jgi:hypothetical protein
MLFFQEAMQSVKGICYDFFTSITASFEINHTLQITFFALWRWGRKIKEKC